MSGRHRREEPETHQEWLGSLRQAKGEDLELVHSAHCACGDCEPDSARLVDTRQVTG